ncbi:hypothetical protein JT258_01325 [Helicobacter pylori]|uniref:hypothetical protein n=1 Tax=Helicobacter pylori TaxID=210 RepID=UPI000F6CFF52|nr:hypothetical protein [Helicobacter pylori]MCQ2894776.1 hypothetical protein [Helicobacter pylori]VEJ22541.1 Uncharacterised protein [Helicobacter pylori]
MLLNYDFLEFVDDEPRKTYSLTASIDKAIADKKLARQDKPSVRVLGKAMPLSKFLDAVGDEISRLKYDMSHKTIKGSTIESSNLLSIYKKIASGLPFETISAFRPFKPAFEKDFTEKEREKLVEAYKSGYKASQLDKVAKKWNDDPNPIDASYLADAFLREYRTIALKLSTALGKSFINKFLNPKSETTMRDLMSSKEFVTRYRYTQKDNMERTRQLKLLLDSKRHFLGYIQVIGYWKESLKDDIIPDKETSFFVFTNEPSSTFYLRNHLLLWARQFNQAAICYCENSVYNNKDRYYVELVSAEPEKFGKVWAKFTGIKFSVPSDLPQALTRINDSVYTFLSKYKGGLGINKIVKTELRATCMPYDYSKLGIGTIGEEIRGNIKALQKITRGYGHPKEFFLDAMIERQKEAIKRIEARKCAVSDDYRQSMKRNIQVSKIAKAMRQGKKVSKTLIAKVLANTIDTDAGYCFISPTDLATQLDSISPRLSKSIVTAIEQAEGIRLLYALIDRVTYNSLHNILNFIFDIDNPLSDEALNELVIEVPREALKNVKLSQIKNVLTAQIFDGAYQFKS